MFISKIVFVKQHIRWGTSKWSTINRNSNIGGKKSQLDYFCRSFGPSLSYDLFPEFGLIPSYTEFSPWLWYTQPVPDNSMRTYGVLIELAGTSKGRSRWLWTGASCLRTNEEDEENEWRAEWGSGCNHSQQVSLQADKHHSERQRQGTSVMKGRELRKAENERWKGWQWCTAAEQDTEALVFREDTKLLVWRTSTFVPTK